MKQSVMKRRQIDAFGFFLFFLFSVIFRAKLGDAGMGYYFLILTVYTLFWSLFGKDTGAAIGSMIRSRYARGQRKNGLLVWKYSFQYCLFVGIVGSILLGLIGGFFLHQWLHLIHGYLLVLSVIPLLFLRMITEALGGRLIGNGASNQVALAGIVRQVFFLVFGLLLTSILGNYGRKVGSLLVEEEFGSIYASAGILLAISLAEFVVLLYLLFLNMGIHPNTAGVEDMGDGFYSSETLLTVIGGIWAKRGGGAFQDILLLIPIVVGFVYLMNNTAESLVAFMTQYGLLAEGFFLALVFVSISIGFFTPMLSKYDTAYVKKDRKHAMNYYRNGLHLAAIIGGIGAAYLFAMHDTICYAIAPEKGNDLKQYLIWIAIILFFGICNLYLKEVLLLRGIGVGASLAPFVSMIFTCIMMILMSKKSFSNSNFLICVLVGQVILLIGYVLSAYFMLNMSVELVQSVCLPIVCGVILAMVNLFVARLISPHLGNLFTAIICLIVMIFLYFVMLILTRNISENECKLMPFGGLISALGQMLHVF